MYYMKVINYHSNSNLTTERQLCEYLCMSFEWYNRRGDNHKVKMNPMIFIFLSTCCIDMVYLETYVTSKSTKNTHIHEN